jgi:hypothetical protein
MDEHEMKEGEEVTTTPAPEMNDMPLTPEEEEAKKAQEGENIEVI